MQYSVATFYFQFPQSWQADVFAQTLFDMGFDTIFENKAYIPTEVLDANRSTIIDYLSSFHAPFSIDECPDENWNATWEAEHPIQELPMGVRIIPHCAFGAGYHETTSMMIDALINHQSTITNTPSFRVLDHGTGTGVLAIFAKKLGADYVLALDIDDKSVKNATENAALNEVDIDVRLSNYKLPTINAPFNLILANIHRNVLLAFIPQYAAALAQDGQLWLSGFYEKDVQALIDAAKQYGLLHTATIKNGDWCMIQIKKSTNSAI